MGESTTSHPHPGGQAVLPRFPSICLRALLEGYVACGANLKDDVYGEVYDPHYSAETDPPMVCVGTDGSVTHSMVKLKLKISVFKLFRNSSNFR